MFETKYNETPHFACVGFARSRKMLKMLATGRLPTPFSGPSLQDKPNGCIITEIVVLKVCKTYDGV